MQIEPLFNDKSLKPKERTGQLAKLIAEHVVSVETLVGFAAKAKDPVKATCIESLEYVSKAHPEIVTSAALTMVIESLGAKAPRVKWESARVIGNCIHLFPGRTEEAVRKLLDNTDHNGTVVRWSAAYAVSQILLMRTNINEELIPAVEAIIAREEKNSIGRIYIAALKKISPQRSSV